MINLIKSACIEMIFTEVPFEDRFKLAKESGFEYVEFWSWKDKNIDEIKELCSKYNLKVASFSGDKDFSMVDKKEKDNYIEFATKSIEVANKLNCPNLVIHSNALGDGGIVLNSYRDISSYEKFANMYDVLKTLAPAAEKNKVTFVLEALNTKVDHVGNFLAYTKDSVNLIKMVNSAYIKVLYDIYHMQINEGDIISTLNKYIEAISYIHIADVPGRNEPGKGEINYANVMKELNKLNFNGVIGFELSPSEDSRKVSRKLLKI